MTAAQLPPMADARWLVTGSRGMLGTDLLEVLAASGAENVTPLDLAELDITDAAAAMDAVAGYDLVVNVAAWTAVDAAEEKEPAAFAVNAVGPANLARACARHGARMLQVSTDYVFSGDARTPYPENALPEPRSAYGRTKAAGEWAVRAELPDAHWIVRTAWLYGEHGPNFIRTMLRLEQEKDHLDVVDDQRGQPTWSRDLAAALVSLVDAGAPSGTYHGTSSGECTWFELAREVFTMLGADPQRVRPTSSESYQRPAPRPAYSVLGHGAWAGAGLTPIRDWRSALAEAFPALRRSA